MDRKEIRFKKSPRKTKTRNTGHLSVGLMKCLVGCRQKEKSEQIKENKCASVCKLLQEMSKKIREENEKSRKRNLANLESLTRIKNIYLRHLKKKLEKKKSAI